MYLSFSRERLFVHPAAYGSRFLTVERSARTYELNVRGHDAVPVISSAENRHSVWSRLVSTPGLIIFITLVNTVICMAFGTPSAPR